MIRLTKQSDSDTDLDKYKNDVPTLDLFRVRVANELPDIHHHGMMLTDSVDKISNENIEHPIPEPKQHTLTEIKRSPSQSLAEPEQHAHVQLSFFSRSRNLAK